MRTLHQEFPSLSVRQLCDLLDINRAWYYARAKAVPQAERDVALRDAIERIVLAFPGYGYRRVTAQLHRLDWDVNHKRVLRGLRRRNLVEHGATWPEFFLQPMIMEYVIERVVNQVCAEILGGELQLLRQYALVQASAPNHVQQSQMRAIIQPLLDALERAYTSTDALVARLRHLLAAVRALPRAQQGYADANLVTLLIAAEQNSPTQRPTAGAARGTGM